MPEVGIDAVQFEQVVMVSFFDHFPLIEDEDPVRVADSGKPVGYDERGLPDGDRKQAFLDRTFGFGIHRAGCLVKDHHRSILEHRPGDAEPLPLTSGKPDPAFADQGFISIGETLDEFIKLR